jgi:hypothetical protein
MDGIDYCGGWTDHGGMGISVIGYQWNNEEPRHCLYCLNDVKVTTAILELGLAGELIDPNTGKKLRLAPLEESWKGGKV